MKWKYLLYMMMAGMGFSACSEDNSMLPAEELSEATVHINLQQNGQVIDVATRSTEPMPLEKANKIYHLWLLQYNKEGSLIKAMEKKDINQSGVLELSWSPSLNTGQSTICLIANLGNSQPIEWPAFLADLQKTELLSLPISGTGLYTDKMYMFGYYEGNIQNGSSLNILMGRMAACINIVVTSHFLSEYTIGTEIQNAVTNTHYFPMETGESNGKLTYKDFKDPKAGTISSSKSLRLYYYTGENINPATDKRTNIIITAKKGNNTKTYTVDLGSESPTIAADRNYSLYRNSNYTFNINLKN
ncbi:DUF4906 domain-containing protein [Bacteroides fluxus]|uniref:DUF4906 domain-containing protein n=1 Tax=Bacteroides fluxus TaxID=626930 RepID=UPI0023F2FEF8|nr:DUF4906 domain-containing protein [Bacteroides fluxus]